MTRRTITTTVVAVVIALVGVSSAQTPAQRFSAQAQTYKEASANIQNELAALLNSAGQIAGFTKRDVPLITKHMNDLAGAWTAAAAALEKGDEAGAAAMVKQAQELEVKRDRWAQRLAVRRLQAQADEYLPATEESFACLTEWAPTELDVQPAVAFIEAKKRRSEAYGRLADATTPTADQPTLYRLQDEVFAADVEVQVADMKLGWSREDLSARVYVLTDPSLSSPELIEAKARIAEWRRQREELLRQSRKIAHLLELQPREYTALVEARDKAYQSAKAAKAGDNAKKTAKMPN